MYKNVIKMAQYGSFVVDILLML